MAHQNESPKHLSEEQRQLQPQKPRASVLPEGSLVLVFGGVLFAIVLLAALREVYMHWHSSRATPERISRPSAEPSPFPTEEAALDALNRFFESPDVAAMAANVHDGPRVQHMMEDYYLRRSHPFPTMSRASKGQAMNAGGNQLMLFMVEPFSGPKYPVAVIWEGAKFAVDWESLAAYGTIDWSRFVEEMPGTRETLRVYVQGARNLDELPGAPEGYTLYRISPRDDPQPLTAVADAEVSGSLSPLVENQRVPLTLALEWRQVGFGQAKIPVIIEIVATGWSQ